METPMRNLATIMAALSLVLPGIAHAADAPAPCLTSAEYTALASYAMPSAITGIGQRCVPTLAPGSFLGSDAGALSARYAAAKPAAWPGAKAAFFKLGAGSSSDSAQLLKLMPDATLQQILDPLVTNMVVQHLPADACPVIDRALGVPENIIETFGAVSVACAWAMAQGALKRSEADVAVAISGIAGPDGGTAQKPVGLVVFAKATRGCTEVVAEERQFPAGSRAEVRRQALLMALELLLP